MPSLSQILRTFALASAFLLPACSAESDPAEGENVRLEPYQPPTAREDLTTGELILECDKHIRQWQELQGGKRDEETLEKTVFLNQALAILVKRHQGRLEEQAISGPPRNRAVASAALAFTRDPKVLPLLTNNVLDPHPMVAANALLGLGVLQHDDTPLEPLMAVASNSQASEEIVANLAFAGFRLAQIMQRDPNGGLSSILIPLVDHEQGTIRAQAAIGLGLIGAAHAVPILGRALTADSDSAVRLACAHALGKIGAPGSIDFLLQGLGDEDPVTAGAARGALAKIYGRDLGPDPDSWAGLRPVSR